MSRGILTVGDQMSFDELDGWLGQALPGSVPGASMPMTSAIGPSPIAQLIQPGVNVQKTPGIFDSITSIISSGAQAYGAYSAAKAAKKAAPQMAPQMPYGYGPTLAPTSTGLSGTEIALIVGGGVLVLGIGAFLIFRN